MKPFRLQIDILNEIIFMQVSWNLQCNYNHFDEKFTLIFKNIGSFKMWLDAREKERKRFGFCVRFVSRSMSPFAVHIATWIHNFNYSSEKKKHMSKGNSKGIVGYETCESEPELNVAALEFTIFTSFGEHFQFAIVLISVAVGKIKNSLRQFPLKPIAISCERM